MTCLYPLATDENEKKKYGPFDIKYIEIATNAPAVIQLMSAFLYPSRNSNRNLEQKPYNAW
jgi:hypothetical protein